MSTIIFEIVYVFIYIILTHVITVKFIISVSIFPLGTLLFLPGSSSFSAAQQPQE